VRLIAQLSVAAVMFSAACGADADRTVPATASTVIEHNSAEPGAEARDTVLAWLNGTSPSPADYDARFDEAFRREVPYADFEELRSQVAAQAPWVADDILQDDEFATAFRVMSDLGGAIIVSIVIDPNSGQLTGLLLEPDIEFVTPTSIDDGIERLRAIGTLRLLVADVTGDSCTPIVDVRANEVMPLGSVFKLYVLGAVVAAVDDGTISWETQVPIDDALDSLPSGDTQDLEPGTERSVRELAEAMISVSDNTATDHLIDLVGRDAVEAVLATMGNEAVEQNLPWLTTRELFIIKWGPDGLADRYRGATEAERRALLAGEVAVAPLPAVTAVDPQVPVQVEELEWFASPLALCRALVWLSADETAVAILAVNPGVPDDTGQWEQILFKGGSEPGLLAVAWLTSRDDGTTQVTAGSVVDPNGPVGEIEPAELFGYLRDNAN
jgi:CBS domain-containing protein